MGTGKLFWTLIGYTIGKGFEKYENNRSNYIDSFSDYSHPEIDFKALEEQAALRQQAQWKAEQAELKSLAKQKHLIDQLQIDVVLLERLFSAINYQPLEMGHSYMMLKDRANDSLFSIPCFAAKDLSCLPRFSDNDEYTSIDLVYDRIVICWDRNTFEQIRQYRPKRYTQDDYQRELSWKWQTRCDESLLMLLNTLKLLRRQYWIPNPEGFNDWCNNTLTAFGVHPEKIKRFLSTGAIPVEYLGNYIVYRTVEEIDFYDRVTDIIWNICARSVNNFYNLCAAKAKLDKHTKRYFCSPKEFRHMIVCERLR